MTPKEFIQGVLINEISDIVQRHPYLAFSLIAIGIEFLGKCVLTDHQNWHIIPPEKAFNTGLDLLTQDEPTYGTLDLRNELRNGFAHTLLPNSKIALSEVQHGTIHFSPNSEGKKILVIEIFYRDFVRACKIVLATNFPATDKMNKQFIRVGP
ncbi:MAG: hypothetical protein WC868_08460 [Bacteroidales bacterium]